MINLDQMSKYIKYLSGGDLRSIGMSNSVIPKIKTQQDFDELFRCLHHQDRIVVMRAADCIEKISATNPTYLTKYKKEIFDLSRTSRAGSAPEGSRWDGAAGL